MRFKALLAVVALMGSPAFAQPKSVQDEFFNEQTIRQVMSDFSGQSPESFTARDVEEHRIATCLAWYEPGASGKSGLTGGMKDECLKLLRAESARIAPKPSTTTTASNTASAAESSDPCLNARDYVGCKEVKSGAVRTVRRDPNIKEWENKVHGGKMWLYKDSVRPLKIRGSYGRYIGFKFGLRVWQRGYVSSTTDPGNAYTTFSGNGMGGVYANTSFTGGTTVTGRGGGWGGGVFQVKGDCQDRTVSVNRRGKWRKWQKAQNTAIVLDYICPSMDSLVARAEREDGVVVVEDNSSDGEGKTP